MKWAYVVFSIMLSSVTCLEVEDVTTVLDPFDQPDDGATGELGQGLAVAEGCGIKGCNAGYYLMNPSDSSCACTECDKCSANKYISGTCNATQNTKCSICSTCESGYFTRTKCDAHSDTICSKCAKCCDSKGKLCQAESEVCTVDSDTACSNPQDFKGKVTTGMADTACGMQCEMDVAEHYTSNSTWNFIIKDEVGQLLFQGQPNVVGPCKSLDCSVPMSFSTEPGVSNGKKPKTVSIMPATAGIDSWCMASFCIYSESAGVKFEYTGQPKWMNPGKDGPCGGQSAEWTVELVQSSGKC